MIIQLDAELSLQLENLSDDEWNGLENLATASLNGFHLILIDRDLSRKLSSQSEKFSARAIAFFKQSQEQQTTSASSLHHVSIYACATRCPSPARRSIGSKEVILIPLSYFSQIGAVMKTSLLCENLSDCHAFISLTRAYLNSQGARGIQLAFEYCPGGGATSGRFAEYLLGSAPKKMILAIVDSDRKSPMSSMGSTALSLQRAFRSHGTPFSNLIILAGREIENLIPDSVYRKLYANDTPKSVKFLEVLSEHGLCNARLHIDMKQGLRFGFLVHEAPSMQDYSDVWECIISLIDSGELSSTLDISCSPQNPACNAAIECNCYLLKPMGTSIVDKALPLLEVRMDEFLAGTTQQHLGELQRIAIQIVSWGFTAPRRFAI